MSTDLPAPSIANRYVISLFNDLYFGGCFSWEIKGSPVALLPALT